MMLDKFIMIGAVVILCGATVLAGAIAIDDNARELDALHGRIIQLEQPLTPPFNEAMCTDDIDCIIKFGSHPFEVTDHE